MNDPGNPFEDMMKMGQDWAKAMEPAKAETGMGDSE